MAARAHWFEDEDQRGRTRLRKPPNERLTVSPNPGEGRRVPAKAGKSATPAFAGEQQS